MSYPEPRTLDEPENPYEAFRIDGDLPETPGEWQDFLDYVHDDQPPVVIKVER